MRLRTLFLWITPVLLGAFLLGLITADNIRAREARTYWDDEIAEKVRELVGSQYVDEIGEDRGRELFYGAMEGYLRSLDPYCSFYDPDERRRMEEDTTGRFGGVGILVRKEGPGLLIVGLRKDDPAEKAGVLLGDTILAVGGKSVEGMAINQVTPLIKGIPGTQVKLTLRRGDQDLTLEMARSRIRIDSIVGVRMVDTNAGIGYFRVNSFKESTGRDAARAIRHLKDQGARAFVMDLRQNGGGVLEQGAVALVDLFIKDGPIVQTRGRTAGSRRIYQASGSGTVCPDAPLVVLVDGGSASAAEVVAGAFQDRRRGIMVGERTYGKFLVQSIHRLPQTDMALSITTAKYYTPYGRWLQRKEDDRGNVVVRGGLMPDVLVERTREETIELVTVILPEQHGMNMRSISESSLPPDRQLMRAVQLLIEYQEVVGEK